VEYQITDNLHEMGIIEPFNFRILGKSIHV
jgi:hypothetical protein